MVGWGGVVAEGVENNYTEKIKTKEALRFMKDAKEGAQAALDIEGETVNAMVKNIDYDPMLKKVLALNPNYIRLKDYFGDWTFQKLGANQVKVSTTGHANPEGAIPASVTNLLVEQQPYQMLQRMKVELAKKTKAPVLPDILK